MTAAAARPRLRPTVQSVPVTPVLTMRRYIDQALCSSACCR
ncbi:hypothetical protein ACIRPK_03935 [Kitasatospora sp. NPDC101801]